MIYPTPAADSLMGNGVPVSGCGNEENFSLAPGDKVIIKLYYEIPLSSTTTAFFNNVNLVDSAYNGATDDFFSIKEGQTFIQGVTNSNFDSDIDPQTGEESDPYVYDNSVTPGEIGILYTIVNIEDRDGVDVSSEYIFELIPGTNGTNTATNSFIIHGYTIEKL